MPYLACPNCGKETSFAEENLFEHIRRPELYLIVCKHCNREYTLELTELNRADVPPHPDLIADPFE